MYITQYNVFDALEGIPYRSLIRTEELFRFQRCYLLSPGDEMNAPEKLYICNLETLRQTGCADPASICVLCVGDGDAVEALAAEKQLHAIAVTGEVSTVRLLNLIQDAFSHLLRWSYKVNSEIAAQADFQSLISLSRYVFGDNPLLMVNSSYNVLAVSTNNTGAREKLTQVLELGYFPKEMTDELARMGYHKNSYRFTTPMRSDPPNFMDCPFLMTTFYENRVFYGFMVLYFTGDREPTRGQYGLFTWFSRKIRAYYLHCIGTASYVPSQKETFISDLLLHTKEDEAFLADRARSLRIPMDVDYRICVIQWQNYSQPQTEYVMWRMKHDIDFPSYRALIYQDMLILLMNGDLPAASVQEKARYSSQTFRELLEIGGGYAGFSLPGFPLLKINLAFQQALSAARLGRKLDPEDKLYFYSRYYVYEMLSDYEKRYPLEDVCFWRIRELIGRKDEGFDNYHLLRTFLLTERNISLTARLMHMHRNSIIYRLNQIREILAVDLDDPDIRLRLMLSFKIMELLDGKRLENPREDDGSEKEDPLFLE